PRVRAGGPGRDDDRGEEQGNGGGGLPAGLHQEQSREYGSHRQNGYGVADQHGPLGGFERIENQHASVSRLGVMGAIRGVEPRAELLRSEEHTSELQSRGHLVCRLLLEKKKKKK